jgi:hypothetical protein
LAASEDREGKVRAKDSKTREAKEAREASVVDAVAVFP